MYSNSIYDCKAFMSDIVDGISILTINIKYPSLNDINEFKKSLDDLLANHNKIIIDFSNCDFIDSVILGVVVITHKKLQKQRGCIFTITSPGKIKILFGQTGLDRIIKNFSTRELALNSISI